MKKRFKLTFFVQTILLALMYLSPVFSQITNNITIMSSGTIAYSLKLHVDGRDIVNDLGQNVVLRGVNKHGFEDSPNGHWQRPDGGIAYNTWDPVLVETNLAAMGSWGINLVRAYSTAEFWLDDVGGHRQIVKDLATLASERGIYLMYSFWHVSEGSEMPTLPYPPYSEPGDELVIANEAAFVSMWSSVAEELKDYPNILFELWNEPHGSEVARNSWFSVVQSCIDAIRATGATNLIVVQWDYGIGVNLNYPSSGSFMDWVELYPLNDPLENIVYSTHLYRLNIHYTEPTRVNVWTYDDLKLGLEYCLVDYVLNNLSKPIIIGEIGLNAWRTGDDLIQESAFYNNSLSIFNEWEIGYAGFWWWPSGAYPHLTYDPNYQPNMAGDILRSAINGN